MSIRCHFECRFDDEKLIPAQRLGIGDRKFFYKMTSLH
jgi:hypothetical protein